MGRWIAKFRVGGGWLVVPPVPSTFKSSRDRMLGAIVSVGQAVGKRAAEPLLAGGKKLTGRRGER